MNEEKNNDYYLNLLIEIIEDRNNYIKKCVDEILRREKNE